MALTIRPLLVLTLLLLTACKNSTLEVVNEGSESSASIQSAAVVGTVRDNDGVPVAGVHVVSVPFGRDVDLDDIGRKQFDDVITDTEGNYRIENLEQNSYKLLFLGSGLIKASLSIGPVDFNPGNLVDGSIQKSVVLESYPIQGDGDELAVALFDPEDKKRTTEILVSNGIRFDDIRGSVADLDISQYQLLVVGHDATIYTEFNELIDNRTVIDNFLAAGGSIHIGQLNDFSVEATPMPFLIGDRGFILHTEDAPFNDFTDGTVLDAGHPLVDGVQFSDWRFIEAGQQAEKQNVTFDAAVFDSFTGEHWNIIVSTPANDFSSGEGTVLANADVIIAEYLDSRNGGRIVVNQAAYYQGAFGDLTEVQAIKLTSNVVNYMKSLNTR